MSKLIIKTILILSLIGFSSQCLFTYGQRNHIRTYYTDTESIDNKICKVHKKPVPAAFDTCIFFCPADKGFPINEFLYNHSMPRSLHGWWPKYIFTPVKQRIPFGEFERNFSSILKPEWYFVDTTILSQKIGCGQYREYVKHGSKSGYSFDYWSDRVVSCFQNTKTTYPHQCRFNGTHNIALSVSDSVALPLVGCVENHPYILC